MINLSFKLIFLALMIFPVHPDLTAQTHFSDSLVFQGSVADIGETWRTGTATSFAHFTVNSYFKEPNGTEHFAYVDNYKLFYFKSTDNGLSWSKEQINTGHEGDIFSCALTVDTAGKVFIGITVHDLFNYANPTGITDGYVYFLYDLYCVHDKNGGWTTELVSLHPSNYGPRVTGLFIDANNNIHLIANYYGWYSSGGTAWEWVRNSSTNIWGPRNTIVTFSDAGIDRFIYDTYTIAQGPLDTVTMVMCRSLPSAPNRLFYVRYNGTSWSAPVNITDTVAVAWNRFDALVDPSGHTYIAYAQNNAQGLPVIKVMKDFQPAQTALINLAPNDTIYYFRMHCNGSGLFTMYLTIKNQNVHTTFSRDAVNWSEPVAVPDEMKNYFGGIIVKTDTRRGYFADHCEQMVSVAGPRSSQPYGPDTLFYGSIRILDLPSVPLLISPSDMTVIDTNEVIFSWTPSEPEVTQYSIEIDTSSGFSSPFIDSAVSGTTYGYDDLAAGKTYYWRVKAKNHRGWSGYSNTYSFNAVFLSVGGDDGLPSDYSLYQNYPNPFNPVTTIRFGLPHESQVVLKVYNFLGQELTTVINEKRGAGRYDVQIDAATLPSGVYFYQFQANDYKSVKKFVVMR